MLVFLHKSHIYYESGTGRFPLPFYFFFPSRSLSVPPFTTNFHQFFFFFFFFFTSSLVLARHLGAYLHRRVELGGLKSGVTANGGLDITTGWTYWWCMVEIPGLEMTMTTIMTTWANRTKSVSVPEYLAIQFN